MSNWLAFATVTETLRYVVTRAIAPVGGAVVTTGKPTAPPAGDPAPRVNLFLYQVTPNAHWANVDVPTRDAAGRLVQKPRAAFDLHYLLTFSGEDATQDDQQLLGLVAETLHAQPILTRDLVRAAVAANPFLTRSNLADDVELVRLTPARLSLEELSKVWSLFFELHYELSVAYVGSVVFVEADDVPAAVLPVLERDIVVTSIHDVAIASIGALPPAGQPAVQASPIVPGSVLAIGGRNLRAQPPAATAVVVDDTTVPALLHVADDQITLQLQGTLPQAIAGLPLPVGPHRVRVEQRIPMGRMRPPTPRTLYESALAAFVLQPAIGPIKTTARGLGAGTLTFAVDPPLAAGDTARLLLISRTDGSTHQFDVAGTGPFVQVVVTGLPTSPQTYLVRISVNDIESPLARDQDPQSPTFGLWAGPEVTL